MSILTLTYESQYLRGNTQITVILPDKPHDTEPKTFYRSGRRYKVLWLLHGTYGDHTDWVRRTNIELYAAEKNLVVVMPSGLNSNYSNWNDCMMGYQMYDYLTEELMPLVYGWLPVSDKREDNYIAGLSMGGRGALKFAVNHPEKFAAAAVLSATAMDMTKMGPEHPSPLLNTTTLRIRNNLRNAGGLDAFLDSCENVWDILDKKVHTCELPRLMFACGDRDELVYELFCQFRKHAEEIGLDAHFFVRPGYCHEWRFWDLAIQEAIRFFDLGENCGVSY